MALPHHNAPNREANHVTNVGAAIRTCTQVGKFLTFFYVCHQRDVGSLDGRLGPGTNPGSIKGFSRRCCQRQESWRWQKNFDVNVKLHLIPNWWASKKWSRPFFDAVKKVDVCVKKNLTASPTLKPLKMVYELPGPRKKLCPCCCLTCAPPQDPRKVWLFLLCGGMLLLSVSIDLVWKVQKNTPNQSFHLIPPKTKWPWSEEEVYFSAFDWTSLLSTLMTSRCVVVQVKRRVEWFVRCCYVAASVKTLWRCLRMVWTIFGCAPLGPTRKLDVKNCRQGQIWGENFAISVKLDVKILPSVSNLTLTSPMWKCQVCRLYSDMLHILHDLSREHEVLSTWYSVTLNNSQLCRMHVLTYTRVYSCFDAGCVWRCVHGCCSIWATSSVTPIVWKRRQRLRTRSRVVVCGQPCVTRRTQRDATYADVTVTRVRSVYAVNRRSRDGWPRPVSERPPPWRHFSNRARKRNIWSRPGATQRPLTWWRQSESWHGTWRTGRDAAHVNVTVTQHVTHCVTHAVWTPAEPDTTGQNRDETKTNKQTNNKWKQQTNLWCEAFLFCTVLQQTPPLQTNIHLWNTFTFQLYNKRCLRVNKLVSCANSSVRAP